MLYVLYFVFMYIWLPGTLLAFIANCVTDKSHGWRIDWAFNLYEACRWPLDLLRFVLELIF